MLHSLGFRVPSPPVGLEDQISKPRPHPWGLLVVLADAQRHLEGDAVNVALGHAEDAGEACFRHFGRMLLI